MSAPSSTRRRRTFCAAGPVWCVTSCMPRIFPAEITDLVDRFGDLDPAALAAAAGVDLRLDDPDGTVERLGRANGLVDAEGGMPRGVAMPNLRKISLPWYSWIFTLLPLEHDATTRGSRSVESSLDYDTLPRREGKDSRYWRASNHGSSASF